MYRADQKEGEMDPQTLIEGLMDYLREQTECLVFPRESIQSCPACAFYGQDYQAEKFHLGESKKINRWKIISLIANFCVKRHIEHDIEVDDSGIWALLSKDSAMTFLSIEKENGSWEFYAFPWPF